MTDFTQKLTDEQKSTLSVEELADYEQWEKLQSGESITPPEGYEFELDENGEQVFDETTGEPKLKQKEVPPPPPKTEVKPQEPDYRKKFSESTRRNQIVESQFNELKKILGDITKNEVPTDEEMSALISDWEFLSDREKNNEKKMIVLERRQNLILGTFSNIASETENASKLEKFIETKPELKGKEDEFIAFSQKPANKGASMEVLLSAFLFEIKPEKTPEDKPADDEIPPSLERGTSSGNMPPVDTGKKEYTDEELSELRTKNPKKYHELIRKGII